ncbi:MAG: hypothetical protein LBR60_01860 [Fibrobacter sp.]|jgi:tetratricopeptide (TPR) repeat protein|nr:hypothetical protein [Fibrobacter sp.]
MTATLESIKKMVGKKNDSKAFVWLADCERKEGSLEAALHRLDDGLEKFPNDLSALIVRSAILFDQEKWEETLELCEKVLRRDPYVLSVLYRAGLASEKLERIPQRNLFFLRLHDLDPLDSFWQEEYADISGLENLAPEFELDESDPFESIAALLPEEPEEENINFEQLQNDLGDAFSVMEPHEETQDDFMGEDISGDDISSAFSGFFGSPDDLKEDEPEEPAAPMSVFSSFAQENATAKGKEPEVPQTPAVLELPEEETSASTSAAFDQLFGDDDDLPEESSILPPPVPAAESTPAVELAPASTASTLDDFFGDDELPEEPTHFAAAPATPEESSALPPPIPAAESTPAVEPAPASTTSTLDDFFGDDELPEEPAHYAAPVAETPAAAPETKTEQPAEKEADSGKIELTSEVASSLDALFGAEEDDDWNTPATPAAASKAETPAADVPQAAGTAKPAGTFETLFEKSAESTPQKIGGERSGVDFLMSGDSDDEVENALIQNPHAKLDAGNTKLDENLNTPTLADIYYEQGLYKEALDIYRDLAKREPDNTEIQSRLAEVETKYKESNKDA